MTVQEALKAVAQKLVEADHIGFLYECSSCDQINGNTDGDKALNHLQEMNKGKPLDSNWRHLLVRKIVVRKSDGSTRTLSINLTDPGLRKEA